MLHLHQLDEISRPGKSLASTLFWGLTWTFVFFFYRSPITAHSLPALSLSLSQSPPAHSCVLVFTSTLAELISPCLACPATGLRLAILFCLGLWLESDLVLYISVTPKQVLFSHLGSWPLDYPWSLSPYLAWSCLFFGHSNPFSLRFIQFSCVPFTFPTLSRVTLLCW